MKKWCGEIAYMTPEGPLQSDLCHHDAGTPISDEMRRLLHECLDEWLDKSDGTGNFVLGIEHTSDIDSLEELRTRVNSMRIDIQLPKEMGLETWSDEESKVHGALMEILCVIHRALDDDDECGCHNRNA